jgi:hypothetical protein
MKKACSYLIVLAAVAFLLDGCLTCEKKEYSFEMTGKNSGKLTIRFINIMSVMDEGNNVSADDFDELINTYLNGDQLENDFSGATDLQKKMYEDNGMLCAEVTMQFDNLDAVRLFQYDRKCPIMYSLCNAWDNESFLDANGTYGGEAMPVIFWPESTNILTLTTQVTIPDESCMSLIEQYRNWKNE